MGGQADILGDMSSSSPSPAVPAAMALLRGEPNLAADAALVEVLPGLEPPVQAAALQMLIERSHQPSLAAVVGGFNKFSETGQALILQQVRDFFGALRLALGLDTFEKRAGAIEVIVRTAHGRLVYLLADALRSPCPRTRTLAAEGLHRLTAELLNRFDAEPTAVEVATLQTLADGLAEALEKAIATWEIHYQPKALEAALWMGDRVDAAIQRKLQQRRTKIARPLSHLLERVSDPYLAGFALRALAVPSLRSAAAKAIGHASDPAFIQAVLRDVWLLGDPAIARGCRWIRSSPWLHDSVNVFLSSDAPAAAAAVRLLAACGGPPEPKLEQYAALLAGQRPDLRQEVVWRLVDDESEAATELLDMIAGRFRDEVGKVAAHEVRRRRPMARPPPTTSGQPAEVSRVARAWRAFDRFWAEYDELETAELTTLNEALRPLADDLLAPLRSRLASGRPGDRARALEVVHTFGLERKLAERICGLAYDPDPMVRSRAVSMLARLPGPTASRILRTAMDDQDERVQANAIEALEALDSEDRLRWTESKLESPSNRVRANAVKSLLCAELHRAGEALLDMLEGPSPAHRLSALWVVERLKLRAVGRRLVYLSRNDPDPRVRRRAERVLRGLAAEQGVRGSAAGDEARNGRVQPVGGSS